MKDVVAAKRGDQQAFARLVEATSPMVWATVCARGGDLARAEELAQEVYVSAWQQLHTLRDPSKFSAWVRQIARNKATHQARTLARRRRWEVVRAADGVADTVSDEVMTDVLSRCMARLSEEDVELLTLYYWQERSAPQVASQLGVSDVVVRKRLSRARRRLREDWPLVEASLASRGPGRAFPALVLAALSAVPAQVARATVFTLWGTAISVVGAVVLGSLGAVPPAPAAPASESAVRVASAPSVPPVVLEDVEVEAVSTVSVAQPVAVMGLPRVWVVVTPNAGTPSEARLRRRVRARLHRSDITFPSGTLPISADTLRASFNGWVVAVSQAARTRLNQEAQRGEVVVARVSGPTRRDLQLWRWSPEMQRLVLSQKQPSRQRLGLERTSVVLVLPRADEDLRTPPELRLRRVEEADRAQLRAEWADPLWAEPLRAQLLSHPSQMIQALDQAARVALAREAEARPGVDIYLVVSGAKHLLWRWDADVGELHYLTGRAPVRP